MIGFFENLLFIGKFQKMIGLMILVKSGVHKILFSLRLTVITVRHHQIPVNFFLHDILRYVEGIFAFAHILDNGSSGTAFLQNLTERGLLKLLALLHGSFREYPSFIFIFIIFILLINFKVIILITLHVLDYSNLILKELFYQCHRTE